MKLDISLRLDSVMAVALCSPFRGSMSDVTRILSPNEQCDSQESKSLCLSRKSLDLKGRKTLWWQAVASQVFIRKVRLLSHTIANCHKKAIFLMACADHPPVLAHRGCRTEAVNESGRILPSIPKQGILA
jgi:hypothetical protein